MAEEKIPFNGKVFQSGDEGSLVQYSPLLMDGWVDDLGFTHKRPGLSLFLDLGTSAPVDGLFYDEVFQCVYAVSNGKVFKLTDAQGTKTDITGDGLNAGTRPAFAHNGSYAVFANGGKMISYNNSGSTAYITDADAPDEVNSLGFIDGYILANHIGESKFYWTLDLSTWSALDFASAEAKPDLLRTLGVAWQEILLAGSSSLEFWRDDGENPFSRLSGAFIERGIGAIYTLKLIDNTWFFIDSERRLIRLAGRSPKIISTPIDKILQAGSGLSGLKADHVTVGGKCIYLLHCPDDGTTYAYDYKNDDWAQWGNYDSTNAEYDQWIGNTVVYNPDWNIHLVGSRLDGKIYALSDSVYTDNGSIIRTLRRTGHIDHGTFAQKRCNALVLKIKRGVGLTSANTSKASATLRWRDNGSSKWGNEITIDLGAIGETEFIITLKRLGTYRTRQYEIVMSDAAPFIIMDCVADIDKLKW